jgi:hypothetical protein
MALLRGPAAALVCLQVKLPLFGVGPSPGSAAAAPSPAAASPGSGSGSPFLQASSSSSASKQQQQAAAAPLPSSRHKGIMHRRVQQLDKPAEVSEQGVSCRCAGAPPCFYASLGVHPCIFLLHPWHVQTPALCFSPAAPVEE